MYEMQKKAFLLITQLGAVCSAFAVVSKDVSLRWSIIGGRWK